MTATQADQVQPAGEEAGLGARRAWTPTSRCRPRSGTPRPARTCVNPMMRMKMPRSGQVHEMEIGPPLFQPAPKFVKQPARIEMIENEIAKLEKPDQLRLQLLLVARARRGGVRRRQLARINSHVHPPGNEVRPPAGGHESLCSRRECAPPARPAQPIRARSPPASR